MTITRRQLAMMPAAALVVGATTAYAQSPSALITRAIPVSGEPCPPSVSAPQKFSTPTMRRPDKARAR